MRKRISRIIREILNDPDLLVTDSLSSSTDARWDSLVQVKLIVALEEEFGLRFQTEEVASLNSVAVIEQVLSTRL